MQGLEANSAQCMTSLPTVDLTHWASLYEQLPHQFFRHLHRASAGSDKGLLTQPSCTAQQGNAGSMSKHLWIQVADINGGFLIAILRMLTNEVSSHAGRDSSTSGRHNRDWTS